MVTWLMVLEIKIVKGKGELFYLPKKHPRLYLYGSYTNDLDFGQNYYGEVTSDNIFASGYPKTQYSRQVYEGE